MTRWRRALSAEDGFTLIEMVVAMTVAALMLTGGAAVLGSSLKAIVTARANSQSAELMSETIEQLRAIDYAAVAMSPTDLAGDADIGGTALAPTFDPDGAGPLVAEAIVATTGGAVSPHITTVTRNDQTYTLATYVTTPPPDAEVSEAAYKRVTVRATWTSGGLTHTRQSSTFITLTRRGLPLPNFQVTPTAGVDEPITVNAGAQLVLPYTVVNRGARDAFNLSLTGTPALGATFTFYEDDGGSTTFEPAIDDEAPDSDLNGVPDTGDMETDQTLPMLAVATVPSDAIAGSYSFTLTATSAGQSSATGATRTAQFDVTIGSDSSCAGCTWTPLYLLNEYPACSSAPCTTTAKTNMPMRPGAPTAAALPNFDTDVDAVAGRSVARALTTPAWDSTTSSTMANWRYTVGQSTVLNGELLVDIYVAPVGGLPVDVTVYVNKSTNGSGATSFVATGTASVVASGSFQMVRVHVPAVSTTIANNRFLEVKVVIESTSEDTGAHLAYDALAYPSVVWMPVA